MGLCSRLELSLLLFIALVVRYDVQISLHKQIRLAFIVRVSTASFLGKYLLPCMFDLSDPALKLLPLFVVVY